MTAAGGSFYPESAAVPEEMRTSRLWLRPLRETDAALDYDAVMSSAAELRAWSQTSWPADDFTLAENVADLVRHEREHLEHVAFTFTVMSPEGTRCLGCVYIKPPPAGVGEIVAGDGSIAAVGFWVRASEVSNDLDRHLLGALIEWFENEWAFDRVVFGIALEQGRQAALFATAGLAELGAATLSDGRFCRIFGDMKPSIRESRTC